MWPRWRGFMYQLWLAFGRGTFQVASHASRHWHTAYLPMKRTSRTSCTWPTKVRALLSMFGLCIVFVLVFFLGFSMHRFQFFWTWMVWKTFLADLAFQHNLDCSDLFAQLCWHSRRQGGYLNDVGKPVWLGPHLWLVLFVLYFSFCCNIWFGLEMFGVGR